MSTPLVVTNDPRCHSRDGSPSPQNVGPRYWADAYYQSAAYKAKVAAAQALEAARQALLRGEATKAALAYARFLLAVENDATFSHGVPKKFACTDAEVIAAYPFLAGLIAAMEARE